MLRYYLREILTVYVYHILKFAVVHIVNTISVDDNKNIIYLSALSYPGDLFQKIAIQSAFEWKFRINRR